MKKIWIAVAVLIALALVGDAAARTFAEQQAAEELGRQFDLRQPPEVTLSGWPFLFRLARGNFPEVDISAPRLDQGHVRLDDVSITLEDVDVSLGRLFEGDPEGVRAASGSGEASISGRAVGAILAEQGVQADIDIEGGEIFVTSRELGRTVAASVSVEGSILRIKGEAGVLELEVDLPRIAKGMTYRSVTTERNALVLEMSFSDSVFSPE